MMEGTKGLMKISRNNNNNHTGSNIIESPTDSFLKRYKVIEKIGEGSYSEVLKCKHREKDSMVACKRLKHVYRNWSQVNDIAEITTLRTLPRHSNILQMIEIHYDSSLGKVSLVFEIMDLNLYELIKDRKRLLPESRVRNLMFQLIRAIRHLHKHGIFHRDIKPENILLRTKTDQLKLGDLGSVRGLYSRPPYTEYISTRWYRSPECLLTAGHYSFKMDIWAAGCVFFEILTLRPLFPGSSELDQISRIHNLMGVPAHRLLQKFFKQAELERKNYRNRSQQSRWDGIQKVLDDALGKYELGEGKSKNFEWYFTGKDNGGGLERVLPSTMSHDARDLLKMMLAYDPEPRPTAHRVLQHTYFSDTLEKEFGKEKESKCPIIAIYGDEKGKQMVSQHYEPIDLKTLGDKKHALKRQKEGAAAHKAGLYKKPEHKVKVPPKKSSPILNGAESPATPEVYKKDPGDTRQMKHQAMKSTDVEALKRQQLERKQKELLMKKSLSEMMLKEKYQQDSMEEESIASFSREPSPTPPRQLHVKPQLVKVQHKRSIPDTLTVKKRQVLAGNLPPSVLQNNVEIEVDKNNNLMEIGHSTDDLYNSNNLLRKNKVINHKLTSADIQKINQARKLVQLNPLSKPSDISRSASSTQKPKPTSTSLNTTATPTLASASTTAAGPILRPQNKVDSPYIKPPMELSSAGRKKFLNYQSLKQNSTPSAQQKRIERIIKDSSTMHVPPQVAAAALKYSTQTAAAARQAREALGADAPPLMKSAMGLSNYSNSGGSTTRTNNNNEYSMGKTRFGHSRVSVPKPSSPEIKMRHIMDELDKKSGISNQNARDALRGLKEDNASSVGLRGGAGTTHRITRSKRRLPNPASSTLSNSNDNNINNIESSLKEGQAGLKEGNEACQLELLEALGIDKQKRLSIRRKDENEEKLGSFSNNNNGMKEVEKKASKMSPYTKYAESVKLRSKDVGSNSMIGKENAKMNVTEAGGNPLFPRNRFGGETESLATRKPNRIAAKFPQVADVYPTILDDMNMNQTDKTDWEREMNRGIKRPNRQPSFTQATEKYSTKAQGQSSSKSKGMSEAAIIAAARLGLSLPPEPPSLIEDNPSCRKPPLPPQKYHTHNHQSGQSVQPNQLEDIARQEHQAKADDEAKERRISQMMDRGRLSKSITGEPPPRNTKDLGHVGGGPPGESSYRGSLRAPPGNKGTVNTIDATEAIKRRAARIKAQLREDVYCSSDDDIVSSLRQKFDELISRRAKQISETSCIKDTRFLTDEEEDEISLLTQRSRNERPRKLARREAFVEGDKSPLWPEKDYSQRKKPHLLPVGDSQQEYKSPTSFYDNNNTKGASRSEVPHPPHHHSRRGERERDRRARSRYYFEQKSDSRSYNEGASRRGPPQERSSSHYRPHHPERTNDVISPTKLQSNRMYHNTHAQQRGQMFTPPGNKPVYHSAHQDILLDRKIGHAHHHHNGPTAMSNRSVAAKRMEEQKPPRRRMQHQHLS